MNHIVSKAGSWRPCTRLSKSLKEQLPDAVPRDEDVLTPHDTDHPPKHSVQPLAKASIPDVPAKLAKRQLEDIDQLSVKRRRLSTEVEGKRAKSVDETTTIQHPKPKPAHAAFLKNFVESSHIDPRSGSLDSFVSDWLESLGSDQNTRCRSDSCPNPLDSESVPGEVARSAPQMDRLARPLRPVSTGSWPRADIGSISEVPSDTTGITSGPSRAFGRSLVEDPFYREMNLAANNIYMRPPYEEFPEEVADLVNYVGRGRDSPGPSPDQVRQDSNLAAFLWMGAGEPQVEQYFGTHIFPYPGITESLQRSDRQPMAKSSVPNVGSKFKVSTPVPDMIYGYNRQGAFPGQQAQLISMGTEMAANTQDLLYPFFVIEFKGEGPSGSGSLWAATNQCLGGAASCVNIATRLNHHLEQQCKSDGVRSVDSVAFSIAMNGTDARLYISWKHDEHKYHTTIVENFLLQKPEDYIRFRKYVRNILDWGRERRLVQIRSSLDALLEEGRKRACEAANPRPPPSDSGVMQVI
ncbi:hypothetical protein F4775DRAFT_608073 [Biscogniauxia sp. FL1348]|nr:hypothetical protein F4775DRAFT_608073 [Biscogniauxia sp. FL1348]